MADENNDEPLDKLKLKLEEISKKNYKVTPSASNEDINFEGLEDDTQNLANSLVELHSNIANTEAENYLASINLKKSLLDFLTTSKYAWLASAVIIVSLILVLFIFALIRLIISVICASNAGVNDFLKLAVKHVEPTTFFPLLVVFIFVAGWLFKKVGKSKAKPDNDTEQALINKTMNL